MRDRVVIELHNAFHLAVSAISHQARPGPAKALARLKEALEDAAKLGDVSIVIAGPRWWAHAQGLVKLWLEAPDDVRRDTTDTVASVLDVVRRWQKGDIGLPLDTRGKPAPAQGGA